MVNRIQIACVLFLLLILPSSLFAQSAERKSLGLEGCDLKKVVLSPTGALALASCEGPNSLYYSLDLGSNWTIATGGSFSSGAVDAMAITSQGAFIIKGNAIYKAALPITTTGWTPNWSAVSGVTGTQTVLVVGDYLVLGYPDGSVVSLNTATNSTATAPAFPSGSVGSVGRLVHTLTDLYASVNVSGAAKILKATFSPTTAAVSGSWSDITTAAGLPTGSQTIWNIFATPSSNRFYMAIRTLGSTNVDRTYESTDGGSNFVATSVQAVPNAACFGSTVYLMGTYISTNSGSTWTQLPIQIPNSSGADTKFEDIACSINATNNEQALMGINQGLARTVNLVTGGSSATWTPANTGFSAITVDSVATVSSLADRVAIGTSAGVGFSSNFTEETPTWLFPICPGGDCVGGGNVTFNPSDSLNLFYGSGNIRKGVITTGTTTSIAWSDFANIPGNFFFFTSFKIPPAIPTKIAATYFRVEGATDGGLYFYDTTTGAATETTDVLIRNKPMLNFIAVTSSVWFASRGKDNALGTEDFRGLLRTADAGVTWSKISDTDISSLELFGSFAYDFVRDILYVASTTDSFSTAGKVYSIASAGTTGSNLVPQTGVFPGTTGGVAISNLTVDSDSGNVYASAQGKVFVSKDSGATWSLFYSGPEGESVGAMEFTERDDDASPTTSGLRGLGVLSKFNLALGSNTGFNALGESVAVECRLAVSRACGSSKYPKKGTKCKFTGTLTNSSTKGGLAGLAVTVERSKNGRTGWKTVKRLTTNSSGLVSYTYSSTGQQYYFRSVQSNTECTSSRIRVRAAKR